MAAPGPYTQWHELKGSAKSAARGATPKEPEHPDGEIEVLVRLRRKADLPRPMPGQFLSRGEYRDRYGLNPDDIGKVKAFADHFRLSVRDDHTHARSLLLKGKVGDFEAAFGVALRRHRFPDGRSYRGREGCIQIPSELAGIVIGVFGLDNRPIAWRAVRLDAVPPAPAAEPAGDFQTPGEETAFFPNELARLYNFPDGNGAGQTIGIVELGGGYTDADLAAYFAKAGIAPPPSYSTRPIAGGATNTPAPDNPDRPDVEVLLDMEVAGTVAPGAKLCMYFVKDGTEQQILLGISAAINDDEADLSVLSLSFGGPEYDAVTMGIGQGASEASQWQDNIDDLFQTAGHLGITVCVATGDRASSCIPSGYPFDDEKAHVSFPASSPYALACGGTHITSAAGGSPVEEVWHPAVNAGTGGGISRYFDRPDYQAGIVDQAAVNPAGDRPGRGVPDVCANAAQESGYRVLCDGLWRPDGSAAPPRRAVGGTSASTPLWAALIARLNQSLGTRLGFLNPLLYKIGSPSSAFFDITKGNNGAYEAKEGWDPCTGLGSPNGVALLGALKRLLQ